MRFLVLYCLLAVACDAASPPPQRVAATPTPQAAPAAAPVTPVTSVTPVTPVIASSATEKCPVGDMTHVAVYGFIERELADAAVFDKGRAHTRELMRYEAELRNRRDMKPPRAGIVERELSHVLTTLCNGTVGCRAIGLYNNSGLAIALSTSRGDHIAPLGFADAEWARLKKASEGQILELGDDTHVVFPVDHGVALCIVDKQ